MLAETAFLEGVLEIPFKGDLPLMVAAASLLIIAHLSLGALAATAGRDLATRARTGGPVCLPGVRLCRRRLSDRRHEYIRAGLEHDPAAALVHGRIAGTGGAGIAGFGIRPSLRRARGPDRALCRSRLVAHGQPQAQRPVRGRAFARAIHDHHARRPASAAPSRRSGSACSARGAPSACCSWLPLIYGVYYPQPYLNQILRKLPIAVVDNDLSDLSRRIVETLDASGALSVTVRARTLAEARAAIDRGEAFAAVEIRADTERDVLKGITATSRSMRMPPISSYSGRPRAGSRPRSAP